MEQSFYDSYSELYKDACCAKCNSPPSETSVALPCLHSLCHSCSLIQKIKGENVIVCPFSGASFPFSETVTLPSPGIFCVFRLIDENKNCARKGCNRSPLGFDMNSHCYLCEKHSNGFLIDYDEAENIFRGNMNSGISEIYGPLLKAPAEISLNPKETNDFLYGLCEDFKKRVQQIRSLSPELSKAALHLIQHIENFLTVASKNFAFREQAYYIQLIDNFQDAFNEMENFQKTEARLVQMSSNRLNDVGLKAEVIRIPMIKSRLIEESDIETEFKNMDVLLIESCNLLMVMIQNGVLLFYDASRFEIIYELANVHKFYYSHGFVMTTPLKGQEFHFYEVSDSISNVSVQWLFQKKIPLFQREDQTDSDISFACLHSYKQSSQAQVEKEDMKMWASIITPGKLICFDVSMKEKQVSNIKEYRIPNEASGSWYIDPRETVYFLKPKEPESRRTFSIFRTSISDIKYSKPMNEITFEVVEQHGQSPRYLPFPTPTPTPIMMSSLQTENGFNEVAVFTLGDDTLVYGSISTDTRIRVAANFHMIKFDQNIIGLGKDKSFGPGGPLILLENGCLIVIKNINQKGRMVF